MCSLKGFTIILNLIWNLTLRATFLDLYQKYPLMQQLFVFFIWSLKY